MTDKKSAQFSADISQDDLARHADQVVGSLQSQIHMLEKFVARRFDEVSTEINATSQLLGLAEEGLENRFSEILDVLRDVSYKGDGSTPVNTGVELNAVIQTTEDAAHQILDSADEIANLLQSDIDWAQTEERQPVLNNINNAVQNILIACAFQDLTGQRIGKTLDNLQKVEAELAETLGKLGIDLKDHTSPAKPANAQSQADIDNLFGGNS